MKALTIYNYSPIDSVYLCTGFADPDPLNEGEWLVPAYATPIAIGEDKQYHKQVFDQVAQKWVYVLDESTRPTPAHEWVGDGWVVNEEKQKAIDAEIDAIKRAAFQTELDARLEAAVAIASPLDYANKRKKLPADKAARLAAFNVYIDQLAVLEYSEAVEWPLQPE